LEASALQAPAGLTRSRISIGPPLLRLRSDEQLVAYFRAGEEEAFRVIHDRYRQRLFAYTRQMLASRQDAEEALQDVFVRAYAGLRSSERDLALRAWLYRVAHNRCIDELRRPAPPLPEVMNLVRSPVQDPIEQAEERETLRRLIADIRRLPDQQRSALLMRELTGMSYCELAAAMAVSVPAVKSLLVRARVSLAHSMRARETACPEIREELVLAHDHGRRPTSVARRHLRDCAPCREFRGEVRGLSRQIAALVPAVGPAGLLANLLGIGGGGAAASGGAAAGGGSCATGLLAGTAGHVVTLLAAAAVTAGGAVEIQHSLASPAPHRSHRVTPVLRTQTASLAAQAAIAVPSVAPAVKPPSTTGESPAAVPDSTSASTSLPRSHTVPSGVQGVRSSDPGSRPLSGPALDPSMGPGPLIAPDASSPTAPDPSATTGSDPASRAGGPGSAAGVASGNGSATGGSGAGASGSGNDPSLVTALIHRDPGAGSGVAGGSGSGSAPGAPGNGSPTGPSGS